METNDLIYMDHAATTPVRQEVLDAMLPYFSKLYGNPSGLYPLAEESHRAIDSARAQVAEVLNCRPNEVVFTSGGTESDNTAIRGAVQALHTRGNHIITTAIEHHAVLNVCRHLERNGFEVTYIPVDKYGLVSPSDVVRAVTERTVLVSVMYANNEIGTIEPIEAISEALSLRASQLGHLIPFHTDAVQAAGFLDLDVQRLGVDLMSLSAHKFYGPKGCGVLYVRQDTPFEEIQLGGGQEQARRSGTENVAAIVGAGIALQIAAQERPRVSAHCRSLALSLVEGVFDRIDRARLNGHPVQRLPNNVHFTFKGIEGGVLVLGLAGRGVASSTGSACLTGSFEPSHVLEAIGLDRELAWSSLRLTLGKDNTLNEVDRTISALGRVIDFINGKSTPSS
jgi:cysteine desulfurase